MITPPMLMLKIMIRGAMMLGSTWRIRVSVLGVPTTLAADEHAIVWGASIPPTSIYAQAGALASPGMEAYIGYLNATGEINGRPVRLGQP